MNSSEPSENELHARQAWSHPARWLPLLVLAVSLLISYQLWRHERHHAEQELRTEFDFRAREANDQIRQRMLAYEQVLRGVAGLFSHDGAVTRKEFNNYFARLHLDENYPGIQGMAYLPIVPQAQMERHIAAVRKEGLPEYSINPEGRREIYTPVIYIEPFSGSNLRAFGYDPYADPVRRAAMDMARDLNQAVITGKLKLVQETAANASAGFIMYMPIYRNGAPHTSLAERRNNITGWVSAPFRMDDLMPGLLSSHANLLDFEIYDGEDMSASALLFDSDNNHGSRLGADFQAAGKVSIANHIWTVATRSHAGFEKQLGKDRSGLVAVAGIGFSLLSAWLTWLLASGRERARNAAREMNRELIASKSHYQQMFDKASSIAFLIDPDTGSIVDANSAAERFWGYSMDELRSMNITHINTAPPGQVHEAMGRVRDNEVHHLVWRHRLKSGEIRDIEIYCSPLFHRGRTLIYSILHDITERKQAESKLLDQRNSLDALVEGALDAAVLMDADGVITRWNPQAEKIFGWAESEVVGRLLHEIIVPQRFRAEHVRGMDRFRVSGAGVMLDSRVETFAVHRDGHEFPIELAITSLRMGGKQEFSAFIRDITERRKREEELRLAATVLNTVDEAVVVTDRDNRIVSVNSAFTAITGYTPEEVIGKNPHVLSSGRHSPEFYRDLWDTLTTTGSWHGEIWNRRKPGDVYVEQISIRMVRDAQGNHTHHVATFTDISERKAAEEHVRHLAHYDLLTDLPNRTLITDRLRQALVKAKRDRMRMALMFLDLDKFKPVNDTFGHAVGDLLLKDVAARLRASVRESDTVARIGGDEFVVLLPTIESEYDAMVVSEKILRALERPFELEGHILHISTSIGIAIYPDHGLDEEALIKHADVAMYHAKNDGDGNVKFHHPEMRGFSQ